MIYRSLICAFGFRSNLQQVRRRKRKLCFFVSRKHLGVIQNAYCRSKFIELSTAFFQPPHKEPSHHLHLQKHAWVKVRYTDALAVRIDRESHHQAGEQRCRVRRTGGWPLISGVCSEMRWYERKVKRSATLRRTARAIQGNGSRLVS